MTDIKIFGVLARRARSGAAEKRPITPRSSYGASRAASLGA